MVDSLRQEQNYHWRTNIVGTMKSHRRQNSRMNSWEEEEEEEINSANTAIDTTSVCALSTPRDYGSCFASNASNLQLCELATYRSQ